MSSRIPWVIAGVCLLIAAGALFLRGKEKAEQSSSPRVELPAAAKVSPPASPASTAQPASPAAPAPEKLSEEQRTAILGKIEEASVTYDPKGLPLIEPYLLHPDPEVRAAALNGMITLGEAGAAPILRDAAKKAPTPKEAVALTEAADYLELPPGSFVPKERTAEGTRVPKGEGSERTRPKLGKPTVPARPAEPEK